MNETRVGYATIDILCNMTEEYIRAHIVDKKYVGELHYLAVYDSLLKYLKKGGCE